MCNDQGIQISMERQEYKKETENIQQPRISLSFLMQGVYILHLRQKSGIRNLKIMKE